MAIPSFVTVGANSASASAASRVPALPASIVTNNLLMTFCQVAATGKTLAVSAGWTPVTSINTGNVSIAMAYRVATGSDTAPTWSWTGNASCQAFCIQYTGNATSSPIGHTNTATANTSTTATVASITSSSDNSLVCNYVTASTGQTLAVTKNYTQRFVVNSQGASELCDGIVYKSGGVSDAVSLTITSGNWSTIGFEIIGTGSAAGGEPAVRASQVTAQVLTRYSDPTYARVSQVVIQVLRQGSDVTKARSRSNILG